MLNLSEPYTYLTPAVLETLSAHKAQTCFFTGHRVIPPQDLAPMVSLLDRELESLFYSGFTTYLCGAARGFDLLAASAVLRLQRTHPEVQSICLIPCLGQTRGWRDSECRLYDAVLRMSTCYLLQSDYDRSCMRNRNRMLVANAAVGVAYANPTRRASGTAMTARMAAAAHIPLHNLYSMLHPTAEPDGILLPSHDEDERVFDTEDIDWDDGAPWGDETP